MSILCVEENSINKSPSSAFLYGTETLKNYILKKDYSLLEVLGEDWLGFE